LKDNYFDQRISSSYCNQKKLHCGGRLTVDRTLVGASMGVECIEKNVTKGIALVLYYYYYLLQQQTNNKTTATQQHSKLV